MITPRRVACALALALVLGAPVACAEHSPASAPGPAVALPKIPVTVETDQGEVVFVSEVADSPSERALGLMHRTSLGDREGMIFLFASAQPLSFWMRNTLIPLDMLFIKADHTVLGVVENATPKTDTPRRVAGESQFVLEIPGGMAAKLGIRAGQAVRFYAPLPSS